MLLNYLSTFLLQVHSDIDSNKLAYYGHSWGARLGATILAIEKRIKVGILHSGGLPMKERARPEVDVINFISRVKIPVLMLNGKYDHDFVFEISVNPMYDLLGTSEADKDLKLYNTDHFVPKNKLIKETLNWLDKYLEPVEIKNTH